MKIHFPNISQKEFDYAFECLEDCKQSEAADFGFNHPFFTPGGQYGKQWWQLDSSLALSGYKWIDRNFAETALLNFIESQKEDGRISLWGKDILPKYVAGNNVLQQTEGISSLPKIFDVAYHILQGTTKSDLISKTYTMLKKYLDWWYRDRFDKKTGLITAVFEETFIPYLGNAMEYAAVDTNVEIYVGLIYTAKLAKQLGEIEVFNQLQGKADLLKNAINKYLWDAQKGAYYPFNVVKEERIYQLMASTFYPLRMQIAPPENKERLIKLLLDHNKFNWDTTPLTSVSKDDPIFQVTTGEYQGNASWSGNVWTLVNEMTVRGLLDYNEPELAAQLALKTVCAFNGKCSEFVNPFDNSPHGVQKYAWSASQYIQLIIEVIFGIHSNSSKKEVCITPNLTPQQMADKISITDIMVFDGVFLDVLIDNGKISYHISDDSINVKA